MNKIIENTIKCGKIIMFNSLLAKKRRAFCIDLNTDDNIIYRGFFGLKTVSRDIFLSFAKITDVFDYELPLDTVHMFQLKKIYMMHRRFLFENNNKVCDFAKDLYSKRDL